MKNKSILSKKKAVIKINGALGTVWVIEFATEAAMREYLEKVGGIPHPLGGLRVVLEYNG